MPAALSREEREQQIHALCENTIYSFVGWDGEYENGHSKAIIKCQKHSFHSISVWNFLKRGNRCKQCSNEKRRFSNARTETETLVLLTEKGFQFLRWKESYFNQYSVAVFHCEAHGEYEKDIVHALSRGAKCQKCSGLYRWTQEEREQQVINKNKNYTFMGWVSGYKNNTSRIKMLCNLGHEWNTSLASYVDKDIG